MKHKQLKAFDAVAREGSFSRAAQRLCVTQPALTVQVRSLEKDYGVQLFHRLAQGVALTREGERLFRLTRQLFSVEEEIKDVLDSNYRQLTGDLKLGVDNPLVGMPLIRAYREQFPGVRLDLVAGNSHSVWLDLIEQRVDAAIVTNPEDDPRLRSVALGETRLLIAVARDHPWAGRHSLRLTELQHESLISREDGSNTQRFIEGVLAEQGGRFDRNLKVGSREMMKEAVAAGLGVGFVMSGECSDDPRLHLLEVEDVSRRSTDTLIYLHTQVQRRVVSGLLDLVQARLRAA